MSTGRISIVEAMRGVAAIAVALFHFSVPMDGPLHDVFAYGWIGVDVFFVISGFVIPLSLWGHDYSVRRFPQFMLRRLVRLEPPYLVSIALLLALWHVFAVTPGFDEGTPDYSWGQIAAHFLYAIPLTGHPWISAVYWSLAYEFVFYIVTGLTFAILIGRPVEWTVLLAALVTAALPSREFVFDFHIAEFLAGILVMRMVTGSGSPVRLGFWLVVCVAAIGYCAGIWVGIAVAAAAAAILLLREQRLGSWALFIGSISYSLYLTHTSIGLRVVTFGKNFGSGLATEIVLMIAALAVTTAFAFMFSWLVERPAMRASRRVAL